MTEAAQVMCYDTACSHHRMLSFFVQLLKKDEDGNYNKTAILACTQIVDCLVENVLRIEEKSVGKCHQRLRIHCFQHVRG